MAPAFLKPITQSAPVQRSIPLIMLLAATLISTPLVLLEIARHPSLYLHDPLGAGLRLAHQRFFYAFWNIIGPIFDPDDAPKKGPLLQKCHGVVLEPGPGTGDNIKYYDRARVTRLVLVEPNTHMHAQLRQRAGEAGFSESDGSLVFIGHGAAAFDAAHFAQAGVTEGTVDCVALVHVMCGIPEPDASIEFYRRLMKQGGTMVFYEHVRSRYAETAWWQSLYTDYAWTKVMDGCHLDRPTGEWVVGGPAAAITGSKGFGKGDGSGRWDKEEGNKKGVVVTSNDRWSEFRVWADEENIRHGMIPHVMGWAVKA